MADSSTTRFQGRFQGLWAPGASLGRRLALIGALLLTGLAAAGCGATPEKRYLLAPAASQPEQEVRARLIGLREADLPAYARDERIYRQGVDGVLAEEGDARWADAPERFVTQHLARGIDGAVSADVVAEPWPPGARPDLTVEVVFDRLLADADGVVAAAGQLRLSVERSRRRALKLAPFDLKASGPAGAVGAAQVTGAYAAVLDRLAAQIADEVAALPRPRR